MRYIEKKLQGGPKKLHPFYYCNKCVSIEVVLKQNGFRSQNAKIYARLFTSRVGYLVCTDRHLAISLITLSQPLMLLLADLAAAVYDLPTGTVSLCLAVDSASTGVGRSTMPARQSGTRCLMNSEILTVLIVLNGS